MKRDRARKPFKTELKPATRRRSAESVATGTRVTFKGRPIYINRVGGTVWTDAFNFYLIDDLVRHI